MMNNGSVTKLTQTR